MYDEEQSYDPYVVFLSVIRQLVEQLRASHGIQSKTSFHWVVYQYTFSTSIDLLKKVGLLMFYCTERPCHLGEPPTLAHRGELASIERSTLKRDKKSEIAHRVVVGSVHPVGGISS